MNEKIQHTKFYWTLPVLSRKYVAKIIDYNWKRKDLKSTQCNLPPQETENSAINPNPAEWIRKISIEMNKKILIEKKN